MDRDAVHHDIACCMCMFGFECGVGLKCILQVKAANYYLIAWYYMYSKQAYTDLNCPRKNTTQSTLY